MAMKDVKGHAAGTIHVAPDGSILLLHRSSTEENYAGHWALPGGKAEDGETPEEAADREVKEETGFKSGIPKRKVDQVVTPNGMAFHTFVRPVFDKFAPNLNEEHAGFTWADLGMLPQPLHPAVAKTIAERCGTDGKKLQKWSTEAGDEDGEIAQDGLHGACGGAGCAGCGGSGLAPILGPMTPQGSGGPMGAMDEAILWLERLADGPVLAFDRAPDGLQLDRHGVTVKLAFDRDNSQGQAVDGFERLHVKRAPITKAGVNPYYGREIPKGKELGLEPDKVYRLLRDPDEIKKAASTFHNLPLLSKHKPHTADDHEHEITEGTVGSEAEYAHPYLYNSLAVWTRDGRDYVDNDQKELSSAYGYDADMTPGTYEGEPYDGVMRNLVGNHVCLVKKGRAGPDVALDEALQPQQENETMKLKSMKATVAYGALRAYLQPKLAMDAAMPNVGGALATFEPGKFKESTPTFIKALRKSLAKVKLAQDGDLVGVIEGVEKLMESIDGDKTVADSGIDETDPDGMDDDDTSMDGDMEAVVAYLKSKGVPDEVIAGMPGMGGGEEDPAEDSVVVDPKDEDGDDGKKKPPPFGGAKDKAPVTVGAMDAALKKTRDETRRETIAAMNEVSAARDHVRPITGEIAMAFDSAEGVYQQAFKMQGKDMKHIKGAAVLKEMWDMIPTQRAPKPVLAQDEDAKASFEKMFPHMAKVKRA